MKTMQTSPHSALLLPNHDPNELLGGVALFVLLDD